jgi:hypothetical protein
MNTRLLVALCLGVLCAQFPSSVSGQVIILPITIPIEMPVLSVLNTSVVLSERSMKDLAEYVEKKSAHRASKVDLSFVAEIDDTIRRYREGTEVAVPFIGTRMHVYADKVGLGWRINRDYQLILPAAIQGRPGFSLTKKF